MSELVTDKNGGRSSRVPVRYDLVPVEVQDLVARIFCTGAEGHGEENWRLHDPELHYNHLIHHLNLWRLGDTSENHLGNAVCRAIMLCWKANFGTPAAANLAGAIQDAIHFLGDGEPHNALKSLMEATRESR